MFVGGILCRFFASSFSVRFISDTISSPRQRRYERLGLTFVERIEQLYARIASSSGLAPKMAITRFMLYANT